MAIGVVPCEKSLVYPYLKNLDLLGKHRKMKLSPLSEEEKEALKDLEEE